MAKPVGRVVKYIAIAHMILAIGIGAGYQGGAATQKSSGAARRVEAPVGDIGRLYKLFEIEKVGAHVVIAVDTSLSMKESFPKVKEALDGFGGALQPADLLTVVVFDNDARRVYQGPAGAGAKLEKAMPNKPNPKGRRTDIGAGVAAVLKELEGAGGRLPVVVFMTDGAEDPPAQSRFSVSHDRAWADLKSAAQSNKVTKEAYVNAIGLNKKTDVNMLRRVWPQTQPLTVNPGELAGYFAKLKEKIRRERLRRELAKELEQGRITVRVDEANWGAVRTGTTFRRTITISSTYKKLPVEVSLSGASWGRFESITKDRSLAAHLPELIGRPRRLVVEPGRTRRYSFAVKVPRLKGRLGLKTEEKYRAVMRLAVTGRPLDAGAITNAGVDPKVKLAGRDQTVWFYRSVGQSAYLLSALALAALAATAIFWRRAILPTGRAIARRLWTPPLFGRLTFSGAPAGEQLPRPLGLDGLGRRATIGASGKVRLKGKDIKAEHAEIFTRWAQGEPEVMIRPREGIVRLAKSPGASAVMVTEAAKLKPGSTIQIGDYRIQWI